MSSESGGNADKTSATDKKKEGRDDKKKGFGYRSQPKTEKEEMVFPMKIVRKLQIV